MTPAALATALRGTGLALGVDFAARDSATIGGMAATDAGGAQVLRHGTMRARVAGLEAVLADGRVLRRLSGLVKDNAGYDLPALLVGSEGTLAVITAVRLALVPAPAGVVTALLALDTLGGRGRARRPAAGAAARRCRRPTSSSPTGWSWSARTARSPRRSRTRTRSTWSRSAAPRTIRPRRSPRALEDAAEVRDVAVADDTARRAALWTLPRGAQRGAERRRRPAQARRLDPLGRRWRRSRRRPSAAVAAAHPGARTILYGHLGDGNLHVNVLGPAPDDEAVDEVVLRLVAEHGGSISAEHGVGVAKRRWLGLTRTPEELAAMAAVKAALDPAGVLNPGVVL